MKVLVNLPDDVSKFLKDNFKNVEKIIQMLGVGASKVNSLE